MATPRRNRFVRRRRVFAALLAVTTLTMFPATVAAAPAASPSAVLAPASVTAAEFRYEVEATAAGLHEIPGLSVTFDAAAGSATYLQALNLSTTNVTALGAGDNIGNTFYGTCRYATGAALAGERGAYWASNLVPPGEKSITPKLRWLFVAPTAARYTCVVSIASYSTLIGRNGRTVTMRIPAGASLLRTSPPAAEKWLLPGADARTVAVGTTTTILSYTYTPRSALATRVALNADVTLSTCKYLSSLCSGGVRGVLGTTARTHIAVQPLAADGRPCGTKRTSPAVTAWISSAKHHLTFTNTLVLDKATLAGCASLRITVVVEAVDGNPLYVHGGMARSSAATRAIAYEY